MKIKKSELRNKYMGFIFSTISSYRFFNYRQNVELPLLYKGSVNKKDKRRTCFKVFKVSRP